MAAALASGRAGSDDQEYQTNKRLFIEMLETETAQINHHSKIEQLVENQLPRLLLDIDDLRLFRPELVATLLHRPMPLIPPFEDALNFVAGHIRNDSFKKSSVKEMSPLKIGFTGTFGSHKVSPRQLNSDIISSLVCVEGIVTRCSLIRPKIVTSVHYCSTTKQFSSHEYADATSFTDVSRSSPFLPKKDENGNALVTEFGFCTYKDHQTISIQEMPETAPSGQMPCSVEVLLDDDLVDKCKPGDRVQVVGVYRALTGNTATGKSTFRTVVIANNLRPLGKEIRAARALTKDDVAAIIKVSSRKDIFDLLGRSIAPSIFGHDIVKKSLILTLIGGAEKNLSTGTHLRGDINLLMIGDPSTAKSQLLRCILNTAPLAISTTGRGSSGVGLTAAVTQDRDTGERRLEAGAMVLADRGIVCIDEFDKMSDADRTAIHEVMEQQTVTIAKAGIHTTLNARCSVVAAANPIYGQYDDKKKPQENIGLPDSILSRFDLLFIILDEMNPDVDRCIADHVLGLHQFVNASSIDAHHFSEESSFPDDPSDHCVVYQKSRGVSREGDVLCSSFLKKYIQFIKAKPTMPVLSSDAVDFITDAYCKLRAREDQAVPITARLLETLIRLATAHARCRLRKDVEISDAKAASDILHFALYQECSRDDSNSGAAAGQSDQKSQITRSGNNVQSQSSTIARRLSHLRSFPETSRRRSHMESVDSSDHLTKKASGSHQSEHHDALDMPQNRGQRSSADSTVQAESQQAPSSEHASADNDMGHTDLSGSDRIRFNKFQKSLVAFVKRTRLNPCPVHQAMAGIHEQAVDPVPFSEAEVEKYLQILQSRDHLMYVEGMIHFT